MAAFALRQLVEHPATGFRGTVDATFGNLKTAIGCGIIDPGWLAEQRFPPSTVHQTFYSVVNDEGAILAGEAELICG